MRRIIIGDVISWVLLNLAVLVLVQERFNWMLFPLASALTIATISVVGWVWRRRRSRVVVA
ncbi:hypothetical protein [Arthrobacter antioxidans]|uniref:hypothetical protein n=1 Tax=Arthrobacter antioxidans TaxID=2895818 RepID=UPI001FFEA526|nr:hypothetical protein [Arthrobacter antioxidans]